jgi:hypothetical protein
VVVGKCLVLRRKIRKRATAPDTRRMLVNPAASIAPVPRAYRHSTELAANATSAQTVTRKTFTIVFREGASTSLMIDSKVMCNLVVIFPGVLSLSDLVHPKNQNPPKNQGRIMDIFFHFKALKLIPSVPKLVALPACGASLKTSLRQVMAKSLNPHDKTSDSSSSSRRAPAIQPVHKSILRFALSGTSFWTRISAICNRPSGWSNVNPAHQRKIDDDAAITRCVSSRIMPGPTHCRE